MLRLHNLATVFARQTPLGARAGYGGRNVIPLLATAPAAQYGWEKRKTSCHVVKPEMFSDTVSATAHGRTEATESLLASPA